MSTPVVIIIKGDNQFDGVADQVQEALKDVQKETDNVSKSWLDIDKIGSKVWGGIKTAVSVVMDTLSTVATVSGTAFTALGIAGTVALTGIVSAGSDFEQKMANVASVTGATGEELAKMSQVALDLGSNSRAGAGAAADAMYYLGSAGYDTSQTIAALDGVINLATATMTDLASTSATVVSSITAFGLNAEDATRVSNVFAAAIAKSQLEMGNLAEAIKYVAPVAGVLGLSLEETTAALALMSNAGFKGSMAGAALRNIMTDLLNPTDMARDALAKYGLTFEDISPETQSFTDILRTLGNASISAGDLMMIFGERGGPQLMALLQQGSGALAEMTSQVTGTNAATEMMNAQLDTVRGAWDLLKSALEGVRIQLFQFLAPVLQSTIEYITRIVQQVRAWIETNGAVVSWGMVVVTAISAILGPIMLAVGAFTGLALAMVALAPVFVPLIGLFGLLVAAIYSVIETVLQADIDWSDAWEHVKDVFSYVWGTIKDIFYDVIDNWFPDFEAAGNDFGQWWADNHEWMFQTAKDTWDSIVNWISDALDTIKEYWSGIIGPALEGDWETVWNNIKESVQIALDDIEDKLDKWWEKLTPKITNWIIDLGIALTPTLAQLGVDMAFAILNAFWTRFLEGLNPLTQFKNFQGSFEEFYEWMRNWWNGWSNAAGESYYNNAGTGHMTTDLPDQGDEWDFGYKNKRSGSAPGRSMTVNATFNISGVNDPDQLTKMVWYRLQGLMQRGAI